MCCGSATTPLPPKLGIASYRKTGHTKESVLPTATVPSGISNRCGVGSTYWVSCRKSNSASLAIDGLVLLLAYAHVGRHQRCVCCSTSGLTMVILIVQDTSVFVTAWVIS